MTAALQNRPRSPGRSARRASRVPIAAPVIVAALLAAFATLAAPRPAGALYKGEMAHVAGDVADGEGHPMADLTVTLTASRSYFSIHHLRPAEASARTVSAKTDARGHYVLDWPWDDFYNHFVVSVGLAVRKARGDQVETLESQDVSQSMGGGAVTAPFTIKNAAYVEKVRRFVSGIASDDERRVYDEMGHPDEVKSVRYPDHDEVSWWFFESGKVYRFEGGRLAQVVPFDPVKPF